MIRINYRREWKNKTRKQYLKEYENKKIYVQHMDIGYQKDIKQ